MTPCKADAERIGNALGNDKARSGYDHTRAYRVWYADGKWFVEFVGGAFSRAGEKHVSMDLTEALLSCAQELDGLDAEDNDD